MCQVYQWWGSKNEPPPHLKTQKQLAEIGMKPIKPAGVIHTRKYDLYLYDPSNLESAISKKKASVTQLKALAKGREKQRLKREYREWYGFIGRFLKDKNRGIEWAKKQLETEEWVILDTETTGLYNAEIVQIGIINHKGKIVLDSLVKPTIDIPEEAIAIHGITNEVVANAPSFPEIYSHIVEALASKKVLIYNANFDISILNYCCELHNLPLLELSKRSECVMEWYAQYCGEWSKYYGDYKWQPLCGEHNAIGDCLATLALIRKMASSKVTDLEAAFRRYIDKYKLPN
jgi:DNA polymerase III subunit epsilon